MKICTKQNFRTISKNWKQKCAYVFVAADECIEFTWHGQFIINIIGLHSMYNLSKI